MHHTRSHYSFLRGASSLDALIERARELRRPWLALADEGLHGAVAFWRKCVAAGIRPVLGARVGGVTLLVRNRAGYSNLCRMLTRGEYAAELSGGLHVLTEDPAVRGERVWAEIVRPGRTRTQERRLMECGLAPVASHDVHFAAPADFARHRLLTAIRENTTLSADLPLAHPGNHLRNDLFEDLPEAVANARRIMEECAAWEFLPAPRVTPRFPLPPGETAPGRLRALCEAALPRRYDPVPGAARGRLERELDLIARLGYSDYFLVVHDIVRLSRERGVPVAGRGSGASSLAAYVLGITNVCPLEFDIPFERFLHEGRTDPPDLDIDFCWRIRDDILDTVFARYGAERTAMVSTHIHLQRRSAFRETAKAFGFSDEQVSLYQRTGRFPGDPARLSAIHRAAAAVAGSPRHVSVHCGGVVIVPDSVDLHAPVQPAEKGVRVTHYDKDGVEEAGLIKIDLLGNRALSTIREAAALAGNGFDVERLHDGDPATLRVLRGARTIGCNQLESPAMRNLLRMMSPDGKKDVMKALALIRPSAASHGMKERFIRRARGLEPCGLLPGDPLADTYGIMLYEDDVMIAASILAGIPLAEADGVRRKIAKTSGEEEAAALAPAFLEKCAAHGTDPRLARSIWAQMARFNEYSFCRAHAASYAALAYASAYLKAHHPLSHWVAALNNNQGIYENRVYLEEAKREGIRVLLPCVNRSGREFTAEDGRIRVGLGEIPGLEEREIDGITANRPFASLRDLLAKVRPRKPGAKSLILCGALDFTGRPRPQLVAELLAKGRHAPPLPDFSERQKFEYEFGILNLSARRHPLHYLRSPVPGPAPLSSRELRNSIGKRVRLLGILATMRIAETSRDERMEFLTMEDEEGIFEVTVFPDVCRRIQRIHSLGPYLIEGRAESRHDAVTLSAERITSYRESARSAAP